MVEETNGISPYLARYCVRAMLSGLDKEKNKYKITAIGFGKAIMDIKLKSIETLTRREIINFTKVLMKVQSIWLKSYGWECEEGVGVHYTLIFNRRLKDEGE